ncbi:MAG: hypothetical protein HRT71_02630, partial [Flavobacteriales bacterium]|nr:hypothetical protein [Flavobacteriales bacterium]
VTVSNENCTTSSVVSMTVDVSPTLQITLTPQSESSLCTGMSALIGVDASSAFDDNTYTWSVEAPCSDCISQSVTPATTTTYTVTVSNENCTTGTSISMTVGVGPTQNIVLTPESKSTVCSGFSALIGVDVSTDFDGNTYAWSVEAPCSDCITQSVTPSITTTYTVTVSNLNCTNESHVSMTVSVVSLADASVSPTVETCFGNESVTITADGGLDYAWSDANGYLSCTDCPNPVASPSSTSTFNVTISDANGCEAIESVTVIVNPEFTITASTPPSGCMGDLITLSVSGADRYEWSPDVDLSCTNCDNPQLTLNSDITYTVSGVKGGCLATVDVPVTLNAIYYADFSYSVTNCDITLEAVPKDESYEWTVAGQLLDEDSDIVTHTAATGYKYTICVEVEGTCGLSKTVCKQVDVDPKFCNCEE